MSKVICEAFEAKTSNIRAYALIKDGVVKGKLVFTSSKSSTTIHCFLHLFGVPMLGGKAGGCGYDKHNASMRDALCSKDAHPDYSVFNQNDDGNSVETICRNAGFVAVCIV